MKNVYVTLILLIIGIQAMACGNEYGHALDGQRIHTRYVHFPERIMHFDEQVIQARLVDLGEKVRGGKDDYQTWSDIALNLMKLGSADSAVTILEPLAQKYPQEYNVLANLGTAYELSGALDSALKYIRKGYEINPKSHRGTEWIHVRILEAKLKARNKSQWMIENSILSIEDLKAHRSTEWRSRDGVNEMVMYQLHTRAPFTPAPNAVMANILETLGDYNVQDGTYENAILSYAYALRYQTHNYVDRRLKRKIGALNKQRSESQVNELPSEFMRMYKRSNIDPELLLVGLDDFSNRIDSLDLAAHGHEMLHDSLALLKGQLDSIRAQHDGDTTMAPDEASKSVSVHWVYFVLVVLLAVVLVVLVRKKSS